MSELNLTRLVGEERSASVSPHTVSVSSGLREAKREPVPCATARILVADPDPKMRQEVAGHLRSQGYLVDLATDGDEVLWLSDMHPYDVVVLESQLAGSDGLGVVRALRRKDKPVRAMFLSSRGSVEDRVAGLDAGADEYLVKPFAPQELLARVRALLRRDRPRQTTLLRVADLELDLVSRRAHRAGHKIPLTNREAALLEFLMVNSPKPMSKTLIVEQVWEQYADTQTNVVNVYVNYLRKKIDLPGLTPLIHTFRGCGFALLP
jgi:two-component system copper resistance phosphate regulon response regulator CusR